MTAAALPRRDERGIRWRSNGKSGYNLALSMNRADFEEAIERDMAEWWPPARRRLLAARKLPRRPA